MYTVELIAKVNYRPVTVETIELPFVPFIGLKLDYPTFYAYISGDIEWNGEKFTIHLNDHMYTKRQNFGGEQK